MARRDAHVALARRLVVDAGGNKGIAPERAAGAGRVYDSLFRSLSPVIGGEGMRAVFARSVKLASADFPCLVLLRTTANGTTDTASGALLFVRCLAGLEPDAASEAAVGVYASLLGVMTKLIGEALVLQIVEMAFSASDQTASKEVE